MVVCLFEGLSSVVSLLTDVEGGRAEDMCLLNGAEFLCHSGVVRAV